jgi:hypothetical protein
MGVLENGTLIMLSVHCEGKRGGIGGAAEVIADASNAGEESIFSSSSPPSPSSGSVEAKDSIENDSWYAFRETLYFANLMLKAANVFASQLGSMGIFEK